MDHWRYILRKKPTAASVVAAASSQTELVYSIPSTDEGTSLLDMSHLCGVYSTANYRVENTLGRSYQELNNFK